METYFILEINGCRYIMQKNYSQFSVTQQEEGTITGLVAIVTGFDNGKYWNSLENSIDDIREITYINNSYSECKAVKDIQKKLNSDMVWNEPCTAK